MNILLPIPFFRHPSCVRKGLKSRLQLRPIPPNPSLACFSMHLPESGTKTQLMTVLSFMRYHISSTCVMSQPQLGLFLLGSPCVWGQEADVGTQFCEVSYFINICVGPFPMLPLLKSKILPPPPSIWCYFQSFPFLEIKILTPPPSLNMLSHGHDFSSCEILTQEAFQHPHLCKFLQVKIFNNF